MEYNATVCAWKCGLDNREGLHIFYCRPRYSFVKLSLGLQESELNDSNPALVAWVAAARVFSTERCACMLLLWRFTITDSGSFKSHHLSHPEDVIDRSGKAQAVMAISVLLLVEVRHHRGKAGSARLVTARSQDSIKITNVCIIVDFWRKVKLSLTMQPTEVTYTLNMHQSNYLHDKGIQKYQFITQFRHNAKTQIALTIAILPEPAAWLRFCQTHWYY